MQNLQNAKWGRSEVWTPAWTSDYVDHLRRQALTKIWVFLSFDTFTNVPNLHNRFDMNTLFLSRNDNVSFAVVLMLAADSHPSFSAATLSPSLSIDFWASMSDCPPPAAFLLAIWAMLQTRNNKAGSLDGTLFSWMMIHNTQHIFPSCTNRSLRPQLSAFEVRWVTVSDNHAQREFMDCEPFGPWKVWAGIGRQFLFPPKLAIEREVLHLNSRYQSSNNCIKNINDFELSASFLSTSWIVIRD